MLQKNYEWDVQHESHHIKVTSWYDLREEPFKGGGEASVDNEVVGSWGLVIPEPNTPILSAQRINDEIRFLNIYATGAFRPKISVEVNGDFIFQDKLNFIDRYLINNPKLLKKLKKLSGM
jgi:hypothetical protein